MDEIWRRFPSGMREQEFRAFMHEHDDATSLPLIPVTVTPELYVRGTVRHHHKTIELHGWHRVYMNTENEAAAMRHVVFMDRPRLL